MMILIVSVRSVLGNIQISKRTKVGKRGKGGKDVIIDMTVSSIPLMMMIQGRHAKNGNVLTGLFTRGMTTRTTTTRRNLGRTMNSSTIIIISRRRQSGRKSTIVRSRMDNQCHDGFCSLKKKKERDTRMDLQRLVERKSSNLLVGWLVGWLLLATLGYLLLLRLQCSSSRVREDFIVYEVLRSAQWKCPWMWVKRERERRGIHVWFPKEHRLLCLLASCGKRKTASIVASNEIVWSIMFLSRERENGIRYWVLHTINPFFEFEYRFEEYSTLLGNRCTSFE